MANEAGGMGALFKNPLFLQYLAGAGGAISQGKPAGGALADITQQNISSTQYMKLLQKMLAGGGKMTIDKDNFNIKAPSAVLAGDDETGMTMGLPDENLLGMANPLPSPSDASADQVGQIGTGADVFAGLTNVDLAGLTPQDISNALQIQSRRGYTGALAGEARARTREITPSYTIPGTDVKVTRKEYVDLLTKAPKDERTAAIKNYEYAVSKGFEGSFEQFQDNSKTTHQKDYDAAVEGGYTGSFNEWMLRMRRAGATRISLGERVAEKEAFEDVKAKKYFTSPKGLAQDVDKYVNTEEVQNKLFALDESQRGRETINEKRDFIKGKITGSGGQIVDVEAEGRTVIWKVKWPDGKTTEVKYAF